ncbi:M20/M25/M40 family metallo-hydrolase [Phenylobacterium sp.]|uniref:M20/M25/M40 family metallo-hydrolase n=1 Tax=Phenylobacterium sp. TaxID=1871053 RepID=UPI0025D2F2A2|nr:M20/M25/M40 family metallo-hydrolase [Phenylobacterium sp.]MBX3484558.1 M20/M25/M40 family metallo-hydrolase [Phenylobacterium sp.]MCW5758363.1 M20/M25/M40 family metallo-hydrolase [Phenylobacterium sp.]
MRAVAAGFAGLVLMGAGATHAQALRPDQQAFREIYKELVETDTSLSAGSCTEAAAKMGARLKAAGFPDGDLHYLTEPDHPKEGGLVAVLPGSDPKAGAVLLLGHLDVVEARREDWTRDPFTLIEEGGYFYGRGTADMKGLDAIWVDTLIRLKQAKAPPKKTLKMALTCGEETAEAFNGADWLVRNKADLIRSDFVLNEGGGGRLSADGVRELLSIQVGEKAAQNYLVTVTNPGGHSSRPRPDNAIYQLAEALLKVRAHVFPTVFTDTTRVGLGLRAQQGDAVGEALRKLLADPADAEAARVAATDVNVNSILHTNCVTTRLDAGHANNALPQRATAVINCRIIPGETVEGTKATLDRIIADPGVKVEVIPPVRPIATSPPLDPRVVDPMRKLAARHFPGAPLIPSMSSGATDGRYFGPVQTPVYGVPGLFGDPDGNGVHGLNERIRVTSLYDGRDYLFDLVKAYVGAR